MYVIKVFSDFCESKSCKEIFEKANLVNTIDFYGKGKKVFFTADNDYTHAILLNTIMPPLTIPKENVLGLACEPIPFLHLTIEFVEYAKKHIGKYFIGDKMNLPNPFIEHFGYMWFSRPPAEITVKTKLMSIILSKKQMAPGHAYRHKLVKSIIDHRLPIDIYGRGASMYKYDRIMGEFNDAEPYEDYLFSICIENYESNHYFSEKIINPVMYNCMPIYWGCKNIDQYIESSIKLTNDVDRDLLTIVQILNNPREFYKKTYTENNLRSVNLIENIDTLF